MFKRISLAAILLASTAIAPAQSQTSGIEVGALNCVVEGGFGLLIGSSRDMRCEFQHANGTNAPVAYIGRIDKLGLDIGVTSDAYMTWAVVAAEPDIYQPGALAGTYGGASASASFAVGLGANVLVGGSADSFALQPLSVQNQTGLNLAVGLSRLVLERL